MFKLLRPGLGECSNCDCFPNDTIPNKAHECCTIEPWSKVVPYRKSVPFGTLTVFHQNGLQHLIKMVQDILTYLV